VHGPRGEVGRANGAGRQRGYCAPLCAVVSETLAVQRPCCNNVARRRVSLTPGRQQQFAGRLGLWPVGISHFFRGFVYADNCTRLAAHRGAGHARDDASNPTVCIADAAGMYYECTVYLVLSRNKIEKYFRRTCSKNTSS